jgi:hypothetical protein
MRMRMLMSVAAVGLAAATAMGSAASAAPVFHSGAAAASQPSDRDVRRTPARLPASLAALAMSPGCSSTIDCLITEPVVTLPSTT